MVREVDISTFANATEDEEKVVKAIRNLLIDELKGIKLTRRRLSGYYGDPISVISGKVRRKGATETLKNLLNSLSTLDQQKLLDEIGERFDKNGNFYVRFDKQKAYLGKVSLQETDPIRMVFRLRQHHSINREEHYRKFISTIIEGDYLL
jgi:RNA binding exosome subunit